MKSKSEVSNKTDFMKYSAYNFIENERAHSEREKIRPEPEAHSDFQKQNAGISRSNEDFSSRKEVRDEMFENSSQKFGQITDVRVEPGIFAPKRYVTTCYLKCFMQPFWYSETMLLTIGSSKKRHEEHVLFKNKLIPMQWSETMTTETGNAKVCSSAIEIPVQDSGYHYISLLPQQIAAGVRDDVTEI